LKILSVGQAFCGAFDFGFTKQKAILLTRNSLDWPKLSETRQSEKGAISASMRKLRNGIRPPDEFVPINAHTKHFFRDKATVYFTVSQTALSYSARAVQPRSSLLGPCVIGA
jgi:hypothetical protein